MQELPKVFFEIHSGNKQEGPGSDESTVKALSLIKNLPKNPRILDIGCGPGRQTIILAKETEGQIIAIDNHQVYLDYINDKAKDLGLSDHIETLNASMTDLDLQNESIDLIWSEGALYIMGFEKGLRAWQKFLKKDGAIAVTEAVWFREDTPDELKTFWQCYPGITNIKGCRDIIKRSDLSLVDDFKLPASDWYEYYNAIEKKVKSLKLRCAGERDTIAYLEEEEKEIEMFNKYSDYYGYTFFIMKK